MATARKIAERVYRLLKYEQAYQQRLVKSLVAKAVHVGYKLARNERAREIAARPLPAAKRLSVP